MNNVAELWNRIHRAFDISALARGDSSPQHALERIAQKCLGLAQRSPFNSTNCSVRSEMLTSNDLGSLVLFHAKDRPARDGGPLVLLEFGGRRVVIDGNNRVNLWRTKQAPGPFEALIIVPNENAA
jgi:hypothetical protein